MQLLFLLFPSYKWRNWGLAKLNSFLKFIQLSCGTELNWADSGDCLLNYFMKDKGQILPWDKK